MMNNFLIDNEIWKDIPEFEGLYQASNQGKIKSLDRTVISKNGKINRLKEKILKPISNGKSGYLDIVLCKKGKRKTFKIHKLICVTFLNYTPESNKIVIDHINGIKTDNSLKNLQIITQRENLAKSYSLKKELPIGVTLFRNKFRAIIYDKGKKIFLGYFVTIDEASKAYKEALEEICK